MNRRHVLVVLGSLALFGCGVRAPEDVGELSLDGDVALSSLMALSEGRLQRIADHYEMLARTDEARSADWERVRGPLSAVEDLQELALLWFALPDGSYWSVQEGRAEGNLSDRPYWPRLMEGEGVLGDLVVSRQTGRSAGIVAVPVRDLDGNVVGALGSSIYLDVLSERIDDEMRLGPDEIFYSFNAQPLVGLNKDPALIFFDPLDTGDPEIERAFDEMLSEEEGVVDYTFRDRHRTVLYRRSDLSGWWYAFGVVDG